MDKRPEIRIPAPLQFDSDFKFDNTAGYFFSNDNFYVTVLERLSEINKKSSMPVASAAMIVGNGYSISTLPEISANTILFCDIDPKVLQWTKHCISTFAKLTSQKNLAELEEEFKQHLFSVSQPTEQQSMTRAQLKFDYENERNFLAEYHFFANSTRFSQCQKAVAEKNIIFLKINLFDADHAALLANYLHDNNITISFINATNLMSWNSNAFKSTLSTLPCDAKMTVVYSKQRTLLNPVLDCQNLCFSLAEFFNQLDCPAQPIQPTATNAWGIFQANTNQPRGYHIKHWGRTDAELPQKKGWCSLL